MQIIFVNEHLCFIRNTLTKDFLSQDNPEYNWQLPSKSTAFSDMSHEVDVNIFKQNYVQ